MKKLLVMMMVVAAGCVGSVGYAEDFETEFVKFERQVRSVLIQNNDSDQISYDVRSDVAHRILFIDIKFNIPSFTGVDIEQIKQVIVKKFIGGLAAQKNSAGIIGLKSSGMILIFNVMSRGGEIGSVVVSGADF